MPLRAAPSGPGLRGRLAALRQFAAGLLIVALAAFLVQATAGPGLAGGMLHDPIPAVGHGCEHADETTGATQAGCPAASTAPDDCCRQACTVVALLPPAPGAGASPGVEAPADLWSNGPGRSPAGILRPPRIPTVA